MRPLPIWLFFFLITVMSCNTKSSRHEWDISAEDTEYYDDEDYEVFSGCDYEDGTHSATVDYYNPNTGYSASYDLEVEVEQCQVTVIYFPNGGWLDDSHIYPADIDESGFASIEGENGKTYDVQLD